MFIVKFKNYMADKTMSKSFNTIEDALAYAKRKYFNPNNMDSWYIEDDAEYIVDDYQVEHPEVKDISDVAEIDYKEFAKNHYFEFNDGMCLCGELALIEKITKEKETSKVKFNDLSNWKKLLVYMYAKKDIAHLNSHLSPAFIRSVDADIVIKLGLTKNLRSLDQMLYQLKHNYHLIMQDGCRAGEYYISDPDAVCHMLICLIEDYQEVVDKIYQNSLTKTKMPYEYEANDNVDDGHEDLTSNNDITKDILNSCKKSLAEKDQIIANLKQTNNDILMKLNASEKRTQYLEQMIDRVRESLGTTSNSYDKWFAGILAGTAT